MNDINLVHFFNNVMIRLSYYDWEIKFTNDSYCWKDKKSITVNRKCKNKKQMILHEIAHINTARFCNQKHNFEFWKRFDYLLRKFLPYEEICYEQKKHRKYTTKGVHGLCYKN